MCGLGEADRGPHPGVVPPLQGRGDFVLTRADNRRLPPVRRDVCVCSGVHIAVFTHCRYNLMGPPGRVRGQGG